MTSSWVSLVVLLAVVASDAWVYTDARRWAAAGRPVYLRVGRLTVATPLAWLVGCVVLWIVFFPIYCVSRSRES